MRTLTATRTRQLPVFCAALITVRPGSFLVDGKHEWFYNAGRWRG